MPFLYTHKKKKSPYRTVGGGKKPSTLPPRLVASLRRIGPLLTNPGCTTVTGIAKGPRSPHAPIDWNKRNSITWGGGGRGWCMLYFIIYPLVMAFNVQENNVFIPEFSKISLPWGGGSPLPPLKNPGYGSECIFSSLKYTKTPFS